MPDINTEKVCDEQLVGQACFAGLTGEVAGRNFFARVSALMLALSAYRWWVFLIGAASGVPVSLGCATNHQPNRPATRLS